MADNFEEKKIIPAQNAETTPNAEVRTEPSMAEKEAAPEHETAASRETMPVPENQPVIKRKAAPRQMSIPRQISKDEITVKIEKVMEEGLNDAFQRLSPVAQQEFKLRGEQTASKIRELLNSTHIKVKNILRLILEWLKMLPGINKFFLEQEAKIKTDKIIALHEKR
jgi:hypothetical protein